MWARSRLAGSANVVLFARGPTSVNLVLDQVRAPLIARAWIVHAIGRYGIPQSVLFCYEYTRTRAGHWPSGQRQMVRRKRLASDRRLAMETIDRATVKGWAVAIVGQVEPGDTFVVEDGFDALADDWHSATSQDEGRFVGGAEVATFAAMVTPFLLELFGDVVKDVVKDQAKKVFGSLLDRVLKRNASSDETEKLRREIAAAVDKSRFTASQKARLRAGFETMFAKLTAA
jgi:hypothetical protein